MGGSGDQAQRPSKTWGARPGPHRGAKRLDDLDLCSSITDGRFREQKFRLKRCGLGHRVHLVEEHGSANHLSLPEGTLLQAVTNTQVIDGFFVKRTADIKESAAYLALLTLGLQRLYQVRK